MDFDHLSPEEIYQIAGTVETLSEIQNLTEEQGFDYTKMIPVICTCVHGDCNEGESACSKCYRGWTGRMCDIAEGEKTKRVVKKGTAGSLIDDDEMDEQIFRPKPINEVGGYEAPAGRRHDKHKDKLSEYSPKHEYGSKNIHDDYEHDDDIVKPTKSKVKSHGKKASVIEHDDDDYMRPSQSSSYSSSPNSHQHTSQPTFDSHHHGQAAKPTPQSQFNEQQGFLSWVFWTFIWL